MDNNHGRRGERGACAVSAEAIAGLSDSRNRRTQNCTPGWHHTPRLHLDRPPRPPIHFHLLSLHLLNPIWAKHVPKRESRLAIKHPMRGRRRPRQVGHRRRRTVMLLTLKFDPLHFVIAACDWYGNDFVSSS